MKTKLFSLFIAVFLFSVSGKSQTNAKTTADPVYPVITLIGSGNGGWTDTAETQLLTSDGITYTLVDKVLTTGELKFREGKCWTTGCAPTVGNTFGWGPTDAQFAIDGGWPSGTNATPVDAGKNIQSQAGVWTITFNRINGSWSFVPGTPLPIIKLVGTAVSTPGGAVLTTENGTLFTAKKVTLVPGSCQFSVDGVLAGALTFPTGDALSPTDMIPVGTTGIDYDVTFDFALYKYTFAIATFPKIAIIGAGTQQGWPSDPQVDANEMTTTDGVNYTISHIALTTGPIKFRQDNSWNNNWGGSTWPSGTPTGDNIPAVAGNYNGTFNKSTGAYAFTLNTIAIVGSGVPGGWPSDPQVDVNAMSTVDGVNYTLNGLVVTTGAAKFRENNSWGTNWGGVGFPSGTTSGSDINTVAGTYNLSFNRTTGAYNFATVLAVDKFSAANFKAYPNPTKNSWNITSNDDITSVKVYDILGKSVYTKTTSSKEVTVNASELSKGVYFAKVSTANGTSTVKLVKE